MIHSYDHNGDFVTMIDTDHTIFGNLRSKLDISRFHLTRGDVCGLPTTSVCLLVNRQVGCLAMRQIIEVGTFKTHRTIREEIDHSA